MQSNGQKVACALLTLALLTANFAVYNVKAQADYDYEVTEKSPGVNLTAGGEEKILWVKLKNTGTMNWQSFDPNYQVKELIRLGTIRPTDRNSGFYVDKNWLSTNRAHWADQNATGPGGIMSFGFKVAAPDDMPSGTYTECFAPVIENRTWMADKNLCWDITVTGGQVKTYMAEVINDYETSYFDLAPGSVKDITLQAKNTGTATWKKNGLNPVHLGTDYPRDAKGKLYNSSWLNENRPAGLEEEEVKPGEIGTFRFKITVPKDAQIGDYFDENYRLVAEGKQWMYSYEKNYYDDGLNYASACANKLNNKEAYTQCAMMYDGFMVVVQVVEDITKIETHVGEEFTIKLDSNGTTGYTWDFVQQGDTNLIELKKSGTEETCPADLVGCGNPQYWTYKALKEGQTEIELKYYRPWETNVDPLQTKKYNVLVLSKMEAQNNVKQMMTNLSEVKSLEYNGELNAASTDSSDNTSLNLTFKGGTDENNSSNPLGYFFLGFNLSDSLSDASYKGDFETRTIDNIVYIKFNYTSEVSDPDMQKVLDVVNDQWIKIDPQSLNDSGLNDTLWQDQLQQLQDQQQLTSEQKENIKNLATKYQVMKITEIMADTTVNGASVYHYQYLIDMQELQSMMEELNNTINPDSNPYKSRSISEVQNIVGEIWIGKSDLLPYKMTVEPQIDETVNMDFVLYMKNFNKPLNLDIPSPVKTIEDIQNEIDKIENDASIECTSSDPIGTKCGGGIKYAEGLIVMPSGCSANANTPACSGDDGYKIIWSTKAGTDEQTSMTDGVGNTQRLFQLGASNYPAAAYCTNFIKDGYINWHLPARDELKKLYDNRYYVGGFADTNEIDAYISSSVDELNPKTNVEAISFGSDESYAEVGTYKDVEHYFRCIRKY